MTVAKLSASDAGLTPGTIIADAMVFQPGVSVRIAPDAVIVATGTSWKVPRPDDKATFTVYVPWYMEGDCFAVRAYDASGKMSGQVSDEGFEKLRNNPAMVRRTYTFPQFKQSEVVGVQITVR